MGKWPIIPRVEEPRIINNNFKSFKVEQPKQQKITQGGIVHKNKNSIKWNNLKSPKIFKE